MQIPELTHDAFLGGRMHLWQPKAGYRAGIDAMLLGACVAARAGHSVLDLGCGAGAAGLALRARMPGVQITGLEIQGEMAELARRNGVDRVFEGSVAEPPLALRQLQFDAVIANPPYYDRARGSQAPETIRETALGEGAPLSDWVRCAAKRLKPKGYFYMILKADRLGDALTALQTRLGSVEILPIAPRTGRTAELVLLRARKEGRAALKLHAPLILHKGDMHPGDSDHYLPEISDVLRCGKPLQKWALD